MGGVEFKFPDHTPQIYGTIPEVAWALIITLTTSPGRVRTR